MQFRMVSGISDASGLMRFIARERQYDVVLVDTAGRMQDNEPLMRALTKVQYRSI